MRRQSSMCPEIVQWILMALQIMLLIVPSFLTAENDSIHASYLNTLKRAQCTTLCLRKFGMPSPAVSGLYNREALYQCPDNCRQCAMSCEQSNQAACQDACTGKPCSTGCRFNKDVEALNNKTHGIGTSSVQYNISGPFVICQELDAGSHASERMSVSIYLRVDVRNDAGAIAKSPLSFVLSIQSQISNGSAHWVFHSKSRNPFLRVTNMRPNMMYRFRVTVVAPDGIVVAPVTSSWIRTANDTLDLLQRPLTMQIYKQSISGRSASARILWTTSTDTTCYFKLYWMSRQDHNYGNKEFAKPLSDFKYQMSGLLFGHDYTVRLFAYDPITSLESSPLIASFTTATCGMATRYNLSVCVPEHPENLTHVVIRKDDTHYDVMLTWSAPKHTNHRDIILYYVEWKLVPLHHMAHVMPESGNVSRQSNETTVILKSLSRSSIYVISVRAKSIAGIGEEVKCVIQPSAPISDTTDDTYPALNVTSISPPEYHHPLIIGFSVLITAISVISISVCIRKWRKHSGSTKDKLILEANPLYKSSIEDSLDLLDHQDEYELKYDWLVTGEILGQGAFGKVLKAHLKHGVKFTSINSVETVAVKVLKDSHSPEERRNLLLEIILMKELGRHRCIVGILGCCTVGPHICLVMDYCPLGDLKQYLRKSRESGFTYKSCLRQDNHDIDVLGNGPSNSVEQNDSKTNADRLANFSLSSQSSEGYQTSTAGSGSTGAGFVQYFTHLTEGSKSSDRNQRTYIGYSHLASPAYENRLPSTKNEKDDVSTQCDEDNDNIKEMLARHDSGTGYTIKMETEEDISCSVLLSYAWQIAQGMEYMEQHRFVHRDLAARNVLISTPKQIKISDFGLSRDVYENNVYKPSSCKRLPFKWMALEGIFDSVFTTKGDVWSFGILLWEIATLGGCPYPGIPSRELFRLLKAGYRMEKPENCKPSMYHLMISCWHPDPKARPSFHELRVCLESFLEDENPYIDLSVQVNPDYFRYENELDSSSDV